MGGSDKQRTRQPGFGLVLCSKSRTDSWLEGSRLQLDHLRMMTSIVKQGSSLGSSPTFPSLNPHYNRRLRHCLVLSGRMQRQTINWVTEVSPEESNSLHLSAAWGLRPHHQTKPNQTAKSWVSVLTISRSKRLTIKPTTAAYPAQPTRPITGFYFSHSNSSF